MHLIVLGAGLMGVTTAYALLREGHRVTLVERASEAAAATSHANAGLIAASRALPWPTPDALGVLARALVRRDAVLRIERPWAHGFWRWGFSFLRHGTSAEYVRRSTAKLHLARAAQRALERLFAETGIDGGYARSGLLYLCRSESTRRAALERARHVETCLSAGLPGSGRMSPPLVWVSAQQVAAIEPALTGAVSCSAIVGASHAADDGQGDARRFATGLADLLAERGAVLRFGAQADGLDWTDGRVTAVRLCDGTRLPADGVVVALGPWTTLFARRIGLSMPIHPVKGYSLTVPILDPKAAPRIGGICDDTRVAWCPLDGGRRLRLTTGAVFAGWNVDHCDADFAPHRAFADALWPGLCDWGSRQIERWACLRPMTPSSLPILGAYGATNLWWNCGHGHLGWTLCALSAEVMAALVAGRDPALDADALDPVSSRWRMASATRKQAVARRGEDGRMRGARSATTEDLSNR